MSARTTNLTGALRTRLLTFDPAGPDTGLQVLLSGGLHTVAPPDSATYPYGILRLMNRRTGRLDDAALEEEGEVELTVVGRHRNQLVTVERCVDIAEEALLRWSTGGVGSLMIRRVVGRMTLPPFPQPANAEIVQSRIIWRYTWWPDYRTQYATPAGSPPL